MVFRGEISGSQSKVGKTKFLIVFSSFDRYPEIIMYDTNDILIPGKFHPKKL